MGAKGSGLLMRRRLAAAFWFALAGLSALYYGLDLAQRRPAMAFAREFSIDVRRPLAVARAETAPAADMASFVMVDAALSDALEPLRWTDLTPAEKQAWLAAIGRYDEELEAARRLALEGVAARPGWAYHRLQLGQAVYAADRRAQRPDLWERSERWAIPFALAESAAPGDETIWTFHAGAYLENWGRLPAEQRREAPELLSRAFRDPEFVRRGFLHAWAAFGRDQAVALLPRTAGALKAAREEAARAGDPAGVATLQSMWERAELSERAADIQKLEERWRLGDAAGVRNLARSWPARHPAPDFDTPAERAKAARVLELWPTETTGPWRGDPGGDLVRFFLDGRTASVKPEALARTVSALTDVPETVRARVALAAGDRFRMEEILSRSERAGTFEWTPFFVELSRFELKAGRPEAAEAALSRIAPGARGECAVLLARRDVARARGEAAELQAVAVGLRAARRRGISREDLSAR
ncbi:MAG TPA: hypothetical protein PLB02_00965 [Thermoanaerobaculia bacterium]|nr:hypothetical protein [Thermoanaerobaculia bacterium]